MCIYISKTPAAWHRRTTQFCTSCLSFAADSSCKGRRIIQKAKTNAQECTRMHTSAKRNDAKKKRIEK